MSEVYHKILEIIREEMCESEDYRIDPDATFEEMDIDSLDLLEIVTSIEDEAFYECENLKEIPDEAMSEIKTAGDAIEYVEKLVEKG